MRTFQLAIAAVGVFAGATASAAPASGAAERAVHDFFHALAMHDVQAFTRAVVPTPRAERLISTKPLSADERETAQRRLQGLQMSQRDEFLLRGEPVKPDSKADYPVGTVGHYVVSSDGGPSVVTVVRQQDGWRVDVRWWLALMDMMNTPAPPAAGSPEYAVRGLMASLIALRRPDVQRFAMPGADMEILFAGAPSQREPSGVLDAAAMEMPLVEVGTGEFYRLPSGRVVEGSAAADRKLLVGQFGPVEIPFVLHRVKGEWRVEPEPYFALINR
jgi:hypothetical protein